MSKHPSGVYLNLTDGTGFYLKGKFRGRWTRGVEDILSKPLVHRAESNSFDIYSDIHLVIPEELIK